MRRDKLSEPCTKLDVGLYEQRTTKLFIRIRPWELRTQGMRPKSASLCPLPHKRESSLDRNAKKDDREQKQATGSPRRTDCPSRDPFRSPPDACLIAATDERANLQVAGPPCIGGINHVCDGHIEAQNAPSGRTYDWWRAADPRGLTGS